MHTESNVLLLAQPTLTSRYGSLVFFNDDSQIQICGPDGEAPCTFDYYSDDEESSSIPDGASVA
jgi:hypothetical protein